MLEEVKATRSSDAPRAASAQDGGETSRSSGRTATAPRHEGRGDRHEGRHEGRGDRRPYHDDEEEERRPKRRTPAALVKPVNFDFDDPDSDALSRTDFLKLVTDYDETLKDFDEGTIVHGRVVNIRENEVLVDIGFKSEGAIPIEEFEGVTDLAVGTEFDVYLEKMENQDGVPTQGHVINPTVTTSRVPQERPDPREDSEGCLSVPGEAYPLRRAAMAHVIGFDVDQQRVEFDATGWFARCMQHEYDHLNGTLYIDRLDDRQFKKARKAVKRNGWGKPGGTWLPGVDPDPFGHDEDAEHDHAHGRADHEHAHSEGM